MAECSRCGKTTPMPFRCKFCNEAFCSTHRLPENHSCEGLRAYKDESRGDGKIGYDVIKDDLRSTDSAPTPSTPARMQRVLDRLPFQVTYAVLAVIMAVFAIQVVQPRLFDWFALAPELALTQPWRLVTSIFLHGDVMHLLLNSIVLVSFGTAMERLIGARRFLLVLFTGAFVSSVTYALAAGMVYPIIPDVGPGLPLGAAVGLSGGLYAIVTMLALIRPDITVLAYLIIPLRIRTAVTIFGTMDVVNASAHAVGVVLPVIGMFASAGHLGGLLTGIYFGYRFREQYRSPLQMVPFTVSSMD